MLVPCPTCRRRLRADERCTFCRATRSAIAGLTALGIGVGHGGQSIGALHSPSPLQMTPPVERVADDDVADDDDPP